VSKRYSKTYTKRTLHSNRRPERISCEYGGYVVRTLYAGTARETTRSYELRVRGPHEWDPTYFGDGSQIVEAIKAKCKSKGWKDGTYDVSEVWRYSR